MKSKWISFLLTGALCLSFLSGCGQEKAEETPLVVEQPAGNTENTDGSEAEAETDSQNAAEVETQETEEDTQESSENVLPLEQSMEFVFSSGAGAWGTQLTLNTDGTFTGNFGDTDMSEGGDDYQAIHYFCNFSGKFGNIKKLNEYSYSMTLEELQPEEAEEHIEDEILYEPSDPYGMTDGKNFVLFTPDTPVSELDEEFKSWHYMEEGQEKLSCYGLWNQETGDGFFTYE